MIFCTNATPNNASVGSDGASLNSITSRVGAAVAGDSTSLRTAASSSHPGDIAPRSSLTTDLPLLAHHLQNLRESGLTDTTIRLEGFHSETDPRKITQILRWMYAGAAGKAAKLGPCLVVPFHGLDGQPTGFARIRPDHQRPGYGKYEQPLGTPLRLYFPHGARQALTDPAALILFTEGEKKSLAATQAGYPCIGLLGVEAFAKKREKQQGKPKGDRILLSDFDAINWAGRRVVIVFDTDPQINPDVNRARAEFARLLHGRGAVVSVLDLPCGPVDENGVPSKVGLDDFIVRHGDTSLREMIELHLRPPHMAARSTDDYRAEMRRLRIESLDTPGVYLDRSATGAGKSTADMEAMKKAGSSLTILHTHRNCEEVERSLNENGIDAVAYPKLSDKTCKNYELAERLLSVGLSVPAVACPTCPFLLGCEYHHARKLAEDAKHAIATHARAGYTFAGIAKNRRFISIHEDPAGLLRRTVRLKSADELTEVIRVASEACVIARSRWPDDANYEIFYRMETAAILLREHLTVGGSTQAIDLPPTANKPLNCDFILFDAMKLLQIYPSADCVSVCRGLAAGEIQELAVQVDEIRGGGGTVTKKRSLCAIWPAGVPHDATVWISDATADRDEIEMLLDRRVIDATPAGELDRKHPVWQVPVDVTKATATSKVLARLRGVMTMTRFLAAEKIGVILHHEHAPAVCGTAKTGLVLSEQERKRVVKVDYFRSGTSRGSNDWITECDLLIVLGTPRVPPHVIKSRLIGCGLVAAADREPKFGWDYWSGVTVDSNRITVRGHGYRDRAWQAAYRSVVAAELRQAAGRGRATCDHGIPVVIVSNESLGFDLLCDGDGLALSEGELGVFHALQVLSEQNPKEVDGQQEGAEPAGASEQNSKIYNLEFCSVSSVAVAGEVGVSDRLVRRHLAMLESRNLVRRIGSRGGWLPVAMEAGP